MNKAPQHRLAVVLCVAVTLVLEAAAVPPRPRGYVDTPGWITQQNGGGVPQDTAKAKNPAKKRSPKKKAAPPPDPVPHRPRDTTRTTPPKPPR